MNKNSFMTTPKYLSIWMIGWVVSEYKLKLDQFFTKFKFYINSLFVFLIFFAFSNISTKINLSWINFVFSYSFILLFFYKLLTMKMGFIPSLIKKYLGNVLVFYGMISYSLYIIHQPIISTVKSFFTNGFENNTLNILFESSCSILTLTLLAYSTHILIENKLRSSIFR